jgi:uncharacterized membrane protein YdjX (TVP38/TMEM64 family)
MKISRAGVSIIVILMVVVPLFADIALAMAFGPKGLPDMKLSLFAAKVYLYVMPVYIVYVIIANAIIKEWDKWIKY